MASIRRQPRDGVYYLIDRQKWIRLGRITPSEAKKVLHRYEAESTYLRLDLTQPNIPVSDLTEAYLESVKDHARPSDLKVKELALKKLCKRFKKVSDITPQALQNFLCRSDWEPATSRRFYYPIKLALDFAVEHKMLPENPALKVKLPKAKLPIPKFVDEKTLDKVFEHIYEKQKPAFMILRYSGLRPSEVLRLKAKDVDLKRKVFHLHDTKTDPYSIAPIADKLIPTLTKILKDKKKDDFLFTSRVGGETNPLTSLRMTLRAACKKANVKVSPYQFRHTFLTRLLETSGGNIRAVQQVARHKNISTTTRYAWVFDKELFRAINKV